MKLFDIFRTADNQFWYVLWDPTMSQPVFLSNLHNSLSSLHTEMQRMALHEQIDLSLNIDTLVLPGKFERISAWRAQGMFVEQIHNPVESSCL